MESIRFVCPLWVLISILVTALSSTSFLSTDWFYHPYSLDSLGIYIFCIQMGTVPGTDFNLRTNYFTESKITNTQRITINNLNSKEVCGYYGEELGMLNFPSRQWQTACLLYGAGCLCLCVSAILVVTSICLKEYFFGAVICAAKYTQVVAVIFLFLGLLELPFSLESTLIRKYCGHSAAIFHPGNCQIGWAYMLAIAGLALSIFCPILVSFIDQKEADDLREDTKLPL